MIEEVYVSFETAKLLKEKGFNIPLLTYYVSKEIDKGYFQTMAFTDDKIDNNHSKYCYLAPTQQMAMRWLREIHKIFICIEFDVPTFTADIYKMDKIDEFGWAKHISPTIANCKTYEEAVESALKYCIETIIK